MPLPRVEYDDEGFPRNRVALDFTQSTAFGEPWGDFLQKAYLGILAQRTDEPNPYEDYTAYWNDILNAAQGNRYGFAASGQPITAPAPEFLQALNQADPRVREQIATNYEVQNRPDQGFLGGSPFGDQFFGALLGLGLATGGAAAFGGFAAPAAVPASAAVPVAAEAGTATGVATPAATGASGLAAPVAATSTAAGGGGLALGAGPGLGTTAATLGPISAEGAGVAGGLGATGGIGASVVAPSAASATGVLGTGLTATQLARLAGTGVTLGTALAGGGRGPETRTTSTVSFAPETRSLIGGIEFPLVAGAIDEQGAQLGPLLTGTPFRADVTARFGGTRATNAVQSAVRRGARTTGVRDLGPAFEDTGVLQPQLLGALRQLALQRGAQNTTAVAPGFAPFLAPTTSQRTEGGGPSAFETGFNLASTLGSAYVSTLN